MIRASPRIARSNARKTKRDRNKFAAKLKIYKRYRLEHAIQSPKARPSRGAIDSQESSDRKRFKIKKLVACTQQKTEVIVNLIDQALPSLPANLQAFCALSPTQLHVLR